jgi:AraC family transcriptional activator of pobA
MPKHFELTKIASENMPLFGSIASTDDNCDYLLVFITSGEGMLKIDLQHQVLGADSVFFIRPGQFYRIEKCRALEGRILSFNESYLSMDDEHPGSFYTGNLLQFFSQQAIKLKEEICVDIYETLDRISKEQHRAQTFQNELLKRYFRILLTYLSWQFEQGAVGGSPAGRVDCVKRFLSLVDRNFKERKMVCDYAMDLHLTPNYLNQLVKKVTTHSAGYHIRQRIVLEAKRKAVYSDESMKEIAYSLGFNDIAHFSKLFKRVAGVNFVNFKRDKLIFPYVHGVAI